MVDMTHERIKEMVTENKVFLFMKGTPDVPQCGFSAQVVDILKNVGVSFHSFNVLEDDSVRQGIKDYANWPTIPQLYVKGKFVGGCDITIQLFESGELQKLVAQ